MVSIQPRPAAAEILPIMLVSVSQVSCLIGLVACVALVVRSCRNGRSVMRSVSSGISQSLMLFLCCLVVVVVFPVSLWCWGVVRVSVFACMICWRTSGRSCASL